MENELRKILDIVTESGEKVLRLRLIVKDEDSPATPNDEKKPYKRKGGNGDGFESMTDAQKRYLFRLLAEEGIEKEAAYDELRKVFRVDNLKNVSKFEASREIEKRLAGQKGGGFNDRA